MNSNSQKIVPDFNGKNKPKHSMEEPYDYELFLSKKEQEDLEAWRRDFRACDKDILEIHTSTEKTIFRKTTEAFIKINEDHKKSNELGMALVVALANLYEKTKSDLEENDTTYLKERRIRRDNVDAKHRKIRCSNE